jgi:hypothetical protein
MDGCNLSVAARIVTELLQAEVEDMRARGVPVGEDQLRGLYVSDQEADRILESGAQAESGAAGPELGQTLGQRGQRLAAAFALDPADLCVLAFCLVCENVPELERLVSYVQDDVSKKRPRVELLARVFFGSPALGQAAFDFDRGLRKYHLITLQDEGGQPTPMNSRQVLLDGRVARFLLGGAAIDEELADVGALELKPADFELAPPLNPAALDPSVLSLCGTDVERVRRVAMSLATAANLAGILRITLAPGEPAAIDRFRRGAREAVLSSAALLLEGMDTLEAGPRDAILTEIDTCPAGLTLIAWPAEPSWNGPSLTVPSLDYDDRASEWRQALGALPLAPDAEDAVPALSGKFSLDANAIEAAVRTAFGSAVVRDSAAPAISTEDLYSAARARSAPILSNLARKVTTHQRWEDLILEPDPLAQLREICGMVEHRHRVFDEWGFENKLASGKGVVALFAGQSGTGKTMAAGVVSHELGLDLYKIDLSGVVSKYIGETEKNLGAIFREASRSNAILFFDEADALFGKRSEVKDAHDRYANIETAYLLQQIEEYAGPVVLSTNLKMNLDEAFLRRMHFVVDFPMPEEPYRLRIWKGMVPPEARLADDVDFGFLARQFRISGGNIRNIVLAAAFLGAQDGEEIAMQHFIRATRREFQKLGRMITEADFGEHLIHLG